MSRAAKIKAFPIEEFPVEIPWDLPTASALRVFLTTERGLDEELALGDDYTVSENKVTLVKEMCGEEVTLACVPCPELSLPKFGSIEPSVIQDAFDQMLDFNAYVEARIVDFCSRPINEKPGCKSDCPEEDLEKVDENPCDEYCFDVEHYDWDFSQLFNYKGDRPITFWEYGEFDPSPKFTKSKKFNGVKQVFGKPTSDLTLTKEDLSCMVFEQCKIRRIMTVQDECGDDLKTAFEYYTPDVIRVPYTEVEAYV